MRDNRTWRLVVVGGGAGPLPVAQQQRVDGRGPARAARRCIRFPGHGPRGGPEYQRGPMTLLTVRGHKSGKIRTNPVALVELDGDRLLIAPFGTVNRVQAELSWLDQRIAGEYEEEDSSNT